jgi:hypothetical protein
MHANKLQAKTIFQEITSATQSPMSIPGAGQSLLAVFSQHLVDKHVCAFDYRLKTVSRVNFINLTRLIPHLGFAKPDDLVIDYFLNNHRSHQVAFVLLIHFENSG